MSEIAERITKEMAAKYKLPNALLACIYYSIIEDDTISRASYEGLGRTYYPNVLAGLLSRNLHEIFLALPPVTDYDPAKRHATVFDLCGMTGDTMTSVLGQFWRESDYDKEGNLRDYFNFSSTCITHVLQFNVCYEIPAKTRFEHCHIVSPTGTGKTTLLEHLILEDIATDSCVIVIDSQTDLIRKIRRLKHIPKERLVVIDPTDVAFPIALNIFDIGQERIKRYSPLEYQTHVNGVIELLTYVFGSVLDADVTAKQLVPLTYVLRLLVNVPDATIHTLSDVLEKDGKKRFADHIAKMSHSAQRFFDKQFDLREYDDTKSQLLRRISLLLANPTIENMFSHTRSRLNIKYEMDRGAVILVDTSKQLLKKEGCTFFGRFFLSLITQATLERAAQRPDDRRPTHVYVDECADYLDPNITVILEQARKYKLSLTLAHQQLENLQKAGVLASVMTNTSTKYVGKVSSDDARALADDMHTEWKQLSNQKTFRFSLYVRGYLSRPINFSVQDYLSKLPKRTPEEMNDLLTYTRNKYSANVLRAAEPSPPWYEARKADTEPPKRSNGGIVEKPRRTPDPRGLDQPIDLRPTPVAKKTAAKKKRPEDPNDPLNVFDT